MAKIWYAFFDCTADDVREVSADEFAKFINSLITDGVRNGGTCLDVTAGSGLSVNIDSGAANIQGHIFINEADEDGRYYNVKLEPANPQYPRIDRVVLRLDRQIQSRHIIPVIKLGTADSNPVPPALQRDQHIWELSLARINVAAGATALLNQHIIDERFETDLCGLINSVLGLDPSSWQRQVDENIAAQIALWQGEQQRQSEIWTSQTNTQQTEWEHSMSEQERAWQDEYAKQVHTWETEQLREKEQWTAKYNEMVTLIYGWFTGVENEIAKLQTFDFDNLAALSAARKTTVFSPASPSEPETVTQIIINKYNDIRIADKITIFIDDSHTRAVTTVYAADGVTIFKQAVITTTFHADGSVTEECDGYGDYDTPSSNSPLTLLLQTAEFNPNSPYHTEYGGELFTVINVNTGKDGDLIITDK